MQTRALIGTLTVREQEVLALIAEGWSNAAIGRALCVTGKTVESHVRSVYAKLDLADSDASHRRVQAVLAFLDAHEESGPQRLPLAS